MPPLVAPQMYSVRDVMPQGYEAAVRKTAAIGYAGVEPAGFPGSTPEAAGRMFRELGLQVPSAHVGLPLGDEEKKTLDVMNAIGSKRIVSGVGAHQFKTADIIKATADMFNRCAAVAKAHGMAFGIHNHWWEFTEVEGRPAYKILLEHLDPAVFFELDTYWIRTAGVDPASVVREMGKRAPLLHIKDGPARQGVPMTAVGDGVVDVKAIADAGAKTVEWMIVELDSCATDMWEAVQKSYGHLVGRGLAKGRVPVGR